MPTWTTAATCRGWSPRASRADLLHCRDARPVHARACRIPPTSRKRTRATRTGTTIQSISRRFPSTRAQDAERGADTTPAGRIQPAVPVVARHGSRVHQRRSSPGLGVRPSCGSPGGPAVRRRPRPIRAARAARSVAGGTLLTFCCSNRPTGTGPTQQTTRASGSPGSSAALPRVAESSSFLRLPSVASKR